MGYELPLKRHRPARIASIERSGRIPYACLYKCTLPETSKLPLAFVPLPFRVGRGVVRLNLTSGAILACWKYMASPLDMCTPATAGVGIDCGKGRV